MASDIIKTSMRTRLVYNPLLSVVENANNNGVSVSAIRKFIKENAIDRKGDVALLRLRSVQKLKKENPNIKCTEIAKRLGISYNTAKKYYQMQDVSKSDTEKVSTFDTTKQKFIIKSVSNSQDEILSNILRLYIENGVFDADFTYSIGVFYKRIPKPQLKFDKYPQKDDVLPLDEAYNIQDNSLTSIVIDLPFIIRTKNDFSTYKCMIEDRFMSFSSYQELCEANDEMISLAYNKLKQNGFLIMKTMDLCFSGKQYWIGNYVINKAMEVGFTLEDTFILIAKTKILTSINKVQHHARKYHSYFYVFRK